MVDHKDRLGEKLRDKRKAEEDRFFAKREEAAIEKMRQAKAAAAKPPVPDCPRCGTSLKEMKLHGVVVDECPSCRGIWLDAGELEQIAKRERDSWLGLLFHRPQR
jgi:hypothetical protein